MAYERFPTLFLALMLCLSPWPASGYSMSHLTYRGDICVDECQFYRQSAYYWCHTGANSWGYCSPQQGMTYKGGTCRSNHECGFYGGGYRSSWCYTTNDNDYDYCGLVVPNFCEEKVTQQTYKLEDCTSDCTFSKFRQSFWCYTKNSWGYCSPMQDYTYTGRPCQINQQCETQGQSYSWCFITDKKFDYCGEIRPLPTCSFCDSIAPYVCHFEEAPDTTEICRIEGSDYTVEPSNEIMDTTRREIDEAKELIAQWVNIPLSPQSRSNLLHSENLCIDHQGSTTDGYINLQIQKNGQRPKGESTTLGLILVPIDTSDEEVRQAFEISLVRKAKVKKLQNSCKASSSSLSIEL